MTAAYPLTWPDHIPRSKGSRDAGQFKSTLTSALRNVETSLRLFGENSGKPVRDVVISSNVTLGANKPADPGVAVWFTWEDTRVCIPVDRYSTVEANLQAIHHVLEARRTELRHGTLALVRASMKGFLALPPGPSWRDILSLPPGTVTKEEVERAFRKAARAAHPDQGGSDASMAELNDARDRALREVSE